MQNSDDLAIELRGVVYRDDDIWLAHCLEMDIVAEGKTAQDAVKSLIGLCALQIESAMEEDGFESIVHPAPPEYWKMFFSIREKWVSQHPAKLLEQFEVRKMMIA